MQKKISFLFILFLSFTVFTQNDSEIDPVEIKVVKDYNVFIEEAVKIYSPIHYYPKFKEKAKRKDLAYNLPDRIEQFKFEPSSIEPIPFRSRINSIQSKNFVRLGFGTALNPIAEWSHINNDKNTPFRIHAFHHSSFSDRDSIQSYSESKGTFEFKKLVKDWTLNPKLDLQHKLYNFYGNINESGFKNESNRSYANGRLEIKLDKEKTDIKSISIKNTGSILYGLDFLNKLDSNTKNDELFGSLTNELSYKQSSNLKLKLNTSAQFYHLKFDTFTDKWLLSMMPNAEYKYKALKINGGLDLTQSIVNSNTKFYILPKFVSEVQLIPYYLNFYTAWDRNINFNTLQSTLEVNPYVIFDKNLLPNTLTENRTAGLKGIIKGVGYEVLFNQRIMKDALMFKNDVSNPRYLSPEIKSNMTVNTISLEMSYLLEKTFSAFLKGNIFLYEFDTNTEIPYNLPAQKLSLGLNAKVSKKLNLNLYSYALGGVKSIVLGNEITNPIIFDLNLGSEFNISENFYIFANANNILNSKIANQIGYRTIGFNGQAGFRIVY